MRNDNMIQCCSGRDFNPQYLQNTDSELMAPRHVCSYCYRNYTICFSIEQDKAGQVRLLSVAPHGDDLSPLPDSEVCGLLRFFGFEEQLEIDSWEADLSETNTMGKIRYYMQPASVS